MSNQSTSFSSASLSVSSDQVDVRQTIAELLHAGLETLDTNREAATHYVSRAYSALVERESLSQSAVRGGLVPWQIKRVKAFIDSNLHKRIAIPEMAAIARLGASHFQRAFRASMGISPHAYLIARRVERAQSLILRSDTPLSEIALAAGFSDQAHMTARFHDVVGVTPARWRRECEAIAA
jgi:transcriptional regulator GlxA family with amidase domain